MTPDRLSATFSALADPTRRAILARLALGEASVSELAKPFEISGPAISKHLKVLERAGLISRGREAQWRPCKITGEPLKDVADWVTQYRRFWDESLDRLDEYLKQIQRRPPMASATANARKPERTPPSVQGAGHTNGETDDPRRPGADPAP